jgi:hypothetical protein
MVIDRRDEQSWKESAPMHERLEPHSNVTVESEEQSMKHVSPSFSTEGGMEIDESDEQS